MMQKTDVTNNSHRSTELYQLYTYPKKTKERIGIIVNLEVEKFKIKITY